ncbi:MAG: AmmeMemoRadiSam system protein B [Candidatus Hydrogenedentes bacterium]|nr:AmmeMemoRadiSam system protein B [Candidatus Hydrogenedentota bacterium]
MPLPPLRYLDVTHIEHDGRPAVVLRDMEGFVEDPLVLTPLAFFIAAHLNGENEVADIQYLFCNASGGRAIRTEDIERVVETLDEHGFLLTDKYLALRNAAIDAFSRSSSRPAYLAGKSYPDDDAELRAYLDAMYTRDGAPGILPDRSRATDAHLPCLIVPHIDFERGGHSYAHGYLRMAGAAKPDTVFVFGVAHAGAPTPFVMTRKHFETPLGQVNTDLDLVDSIASKCGWDPYSAEIVQRTEHSIEFQAVMLAHLYGPEVQIVPILCGPFMGEEDLASGTRAKEVDEFLRNCRDAAQQSGKRISIIAGADLAHVGKRFGDPFDIDDAIVADVRLRDDEDIQYLATPNPEQWYASVMKDDNARRVCGLNCIYSALKCVDGDVSAGEVLHYDYAHDPAGGIVSFVNVAYSAEGY